MLTVLSSAQPADPTEAAAPQHQEWEIPINPPPLDTAEKLLTRVSEPKHISDLD